MKIAIVTWFTHNNIGTQLQSYALQNCLKSLNVECPIVDDKSIIEQQRIRNKVNTDKSENLHKIDTNNDSRIIRFCKKYLLHPIRFFKDIKLHYDIYEYNKRINAVNQSINLTEKFKRENIDVCSFDPERLNSEYNAIICGSDQIWSLNPKTFNSYYFLDFAKTKKISYAPSLGTSKIPVEKSDLLKHLLCDFHSISLREKLSAQELSGILKKDVDFVCDPTLLHNMNFWSEFCSDVNIKRKNYLLCYFLSDNNWYFRYAEKLADHLGLKLLLIPNLAGFARFKYCYKSSVGPKEFVSLIKNSCFVLTDSYHGTIFSLLFNKPLIHLKRFSDDEDFCQNIRVKSLIEYLGIEKCVFGEKGFNKSDIHSFNFESINNLLASFRDKSLNYLIRSLDL